MIYGAYQYQDNYRCWLICAGTDIDTVRNSSNAKEIARRESGRCIIPEDEMVSNKYSRYDGNRTITWSIRIEQLPT